MSLLVDLFSKKREDEIVLPIDYAKIHQDYYSTFGITENATLDESRSKFRELCLNLNPMFTGLKKTKLNFKQGLLAFYLCQGAMKNTPKEILTKLDSSPLFKFWCPDDIIPCLKPLKIQGFRTNEGVRAARMLAIEHFQSSLEGITVVHTFKVNYLLRMREIKKTYKDFEELHAKLSKELLMVPSLPEPLGLKLILGNQEEEGIALAAYLQRTYNSLSTRGMFSPRIFAFLGIDVSRAHIEEEGRMVQFLDTVTLPPQSCWQVVDEMWLKKWRKFSTGRAARRYLPPGKVINENLRETKIIPRKDGAPIVKREFKKDLVLSEHYRVVNYNVWVFWQRVHGYDITITRVARDIYSSRGIGYLQAVIKVQCFIRAAIAAKKYSENYLIHFSRSAKGARKLMFRHKLEKVQETAKKNVEQAQQARKERRLKRVALFTQRTWREKKGIEYQEAPLIAMKHAQEVFAISEGRVEEATTSQPLVVYYAVPVITIGTAEEYERIFTEEEGLIIGLTEHIPSGNTYVSQTEDLEVMSDSVLLAINGYPVKTLSHFEVMDRLTNSRWPLKLKFRRPLAINEVYTLIRIHDEIENKEIKIQALKRKLLRGVTVKKHGKKGLGHLTRLFVSETHLFWETKGRFKEGTEKLWKESCRSITLYDIMFVRPGKESSVLRRFMNKKVNPDLCFTIYTESKTLDFEVSNVNGEGKKRRDILVWGFRQIISEMRTTQLFVDKNGNPIRRHQQKKKLRAIDR